MLVSEKAAHLRGLLKQAVPATPALGDMPGPGAGAGGAMPKPQVPKPNLQPMGSMTKPVGQPGAGQSPPSAAMTPPTGRTPGMIPYTSSGGTRMLGSMDYLSRSPEEAMTAKPGDIWMAMKEHPVAGPLVQGGEALVNRYSSQGLQQMIPDAANVMGQVGGAAAGLGSNLAEAGGEALGNMATGKTPGGGQWPSAQGSGQQQEEPSAMKAFQTLLGGDPVKAWGQTPQWGKWGLGIGGGLLLMMLLSRLFGKGASLSNYTNAEKDQAQDLLDRMMKRAGLAQAPRYSRTGYGTNPAGKFIPGNQFQGSATKTVPAVRQTGADAAINKIAGSASELTKSALHSKHLLDQGLGGGLADYLTGGSTWGASRAGRATQMAKATGDEPGFNVAHPLTADILSTLGGATAGAFGGNMAGQEYGQPAAVAGALLALGLARHFRRGRMQDISKRFDESAEAGALDNPDPGLSTAGSLFLPLGGAHRAGQADAYEAISRANRGLPTKPIGGFMRNLGYAQHYAPFLGSPGFMPGVSPIGAVMGAAQGLHAKGRIRKTREAEKEGCDMAVKLAMRPSMMVRIRQRRIVVAPRRSPSVRASDNETPSTNDMAKSKDRKGDFAVT